MLAVLRAGGGRLGKAQRVCSNGNFVWISCVVYRSQWSYICVLSADKPEIQVYSLVYGM